MKLRWTQRARRDLIEIGRYIATDRPGAARRWVETLRRQARRAVEFPHSGRRVPEFEREDLREILVSGYRIVYAVRQEAIEVLTVFDGHQRLRLPEGEESDTLS